MSITRHYRPYETEADVYRAFLRFTELVERGPHYDVVIDVSDLGPTQKGAGHSIIPDNYEYLDKRQWDHPAPGWTPGIWTCPGCVIEYEDGQVMEASPGAMKFCFDCPRAQAWDRGERPNPKEERARPVVPRAWHPYWRERRRARLEPRPYDEQPPAGV